MILDNTLAVAEAVTPPARHEVHAMAFEALHQLPAFCLGTTELAGLFSLGQLVDCAVTGWGRGNDGYKAEVPVWVVVDEFVGYGDGGRILILGLAAASRIAGT